MTTALLKGSIAQIMEKKGNTPVAKATVDSSSDSSGVDSSSGPTFTVLKLKHLPRKNEHSFVIWANQVSCSRVKGVKAVKFARQLHVAKNHVRQPLRCRPGEVTVRLIAVGSDLVRSFAGHFGVGDQESPCD